MEKESVVRGEQSTRKKKKDQHNETFLGRKRVTTSHRRCTGRIERNKI